MPKIKHSAFTFFIVSMIAVLSGCVSGIAYQPLQEKNNLGLVYFYRPYSFGGSGMYPVVKINEEKVVNLKAGGYSYTYLEPGAHTVALFDSAVFSPDAKEPYFKEQFTVNSGEKLYFRWSVSGNSVNQYYIDWTKHAGFVDESIGSFEIQDCKLISPENESIQSR